MLTKTQKIEFIENAKSELKKYGTVGLIPIERIPDRLLQKSKNSIRSDAKVLFARKKLLLKSLEGEERLKPIAEELKKQHVQHAVFMTNDTGFSIFNKLKANQLKLAAKPNQKANSEIVIKSGETSIQPGQTVTELKQAGIDVQIQKGKVVIGKDKVIKKDEVITAPISKVLRILDIKPFTVTIEPSLVLSQNMLFTKDILGIDRDYTVGNMHKAFNAALAICIDKEIINKYTVKKFMSKAYTKAVFFGVKAKLYDKGIVEKLLVNAFLAAVSANSAIAGNAK
ncbi:MAG: 50S ribosomal protein L10 [Candidatus Marsarchaeota archaeon]|nr:50S ribosomal protein L10 [Candidatus Marsarchaeota archaeon]